MSSTPDHLFGGSLDTNPAVSEDETRRRGLLALSVYQPGEEQWASFKCEGGTHLGSDEAYSDQSRRALDTSPRDESHHD